MTTFTLQSTSTTDEIIYWKADDTAGTTAIYYKVSESKWYDGSSGGQPTAFSINDGTPSNPSAVVSEGDSVKLTAGSSGNYGSFTMFSTSSSTPSVPDIQPIVNTGGSWNGVHSWASPTTETINGSVEYHYSLTFGTSRIAYRTIDKTWYDSDTSSQPSALSSDAFSTQSSELVNPQYVWIGDTSATNTDFYISFDNPYYEA